MVQVSPGAGVATVTAMAPDNAARGPRSCQPSSPMAPWWTSTSRPSRAATAPSRVNRPLDSGPRTTRVRTAPRSSSSTTLARRARSSDGTTTWSSGAKDPAGRSPSVGGSEDGASTPRPSRSATATGTRATHSDLGSAGLSTTSSPARARREHRCTTSAGPRASSANSQPSNPKQGRRAANGSWRAAKTEPKRMSSSINPAAVSTRASARSSWASGRCPAPTASSASSASRPAPSSGAGGPNWSSQAVAGSPSGSRRRRRDHTTRR